MLDEESRIELPGVPASLQGRAVAVWEEPVVIDSYLPDEPDQFPAFLHSRVYQGSSGRVFPLPFHERISLDKVPHAWRAVHLENDRIRLVVLPELGGRIHVAYDKHADYDFFYRNNVIKPALVGLTGPWISGGVEFNWPQHHRPATFLPVEVHIEEESDGSVTVWCSDHDPFSRMKGMHGIRLSPGSARIELRVRLTNRSELTQPFLWWANVAVRVGDGYQSFFPEDVRYVADHARRAVTAFPAADRPYYGVDYPSRVDAAHPDADRLDWYRNIPVPTSYMVLATDEEFFGGYDHGAQAGFVHWAPREISPGKKQWTWGNAPFGWAWDRNLTDGDGPYVELMAGVYTDNQPDFAWIAPGETKTFTQTWYPIRGIGPAVAASRELAVGWAGDPLRRRLAVVASEPLEGITVRADARVVDTIALAGSEPVFVEIPLSATDVVLERAGHVLLRVAKHRDEAEVEPRPAVAPPHPSEVATADDLYFIGSYLQQYRHATRRPEPYWEEALRRDPRDSRCATALGEAAYRRGRYAEAERLLRIAVDATGRWAPTPRNAEAHYLLALTVERLGRDAEARDLLARAAWDSAWAVPAGFAHARLLASVDPERAREQLVALVERAPHQHQARTLLALLLREAGDAAEADRMNAETLRVDPLDAWARDAIGLSPGADATVLLDVALEYGRAGFDSDALRVLDEVVRLSLETPLGQVQVGPIAHYHRARILDRAGRALEAADARASARSSDRRWAQASRLDDADALRDALSAEPDDAVAALLLGNWLYDRDRPDDATLRWRVAVDGEPDVAAIAARNLGIAAYNVHSDPDQALGWYLQARRAAPSNPKLLAEHDELRARRGHSVADRLAGLEAERALVHQRDDLVVVLATLLVAADRALEARDVLAARRFQPWEGGEGLVLAAWDSAAIAIAAEALTAGDPGTALAALRAALDPPATLGEARHPLANSARLHLALGDASEALGDAAAAESAWLTAASFSGDFANMAPQPFSEQTVWSIAALRRLGRDAEADTITAELQSWLDQFATEPAEIDYFATSLPTMLLFVDDPQRERDREVAAIRERIRELTPHVPAQATSMSPILWR